MAENVPESAYFPHDKEKLLTTIARFDDGLRVEDVVGSETESDNLKQYSNTVLIQVLLEFICHAFVKEENHREKLLIEACKRLSKFKILNDLLIMDKSNQLRMTMKYKIINFLKQICENVIPTAELNTSAVHLFQKDCLSTDLKLYYCTNFVELGKIAEGGFGYVYKAQYKLNKLIYAVKKIPFDYKTDANFLMVMREANNFAALDHLNIVRYYSAWIEMSESDVVNKPPSEDIKIVSEDDTDGEYSGLVVKRNPSSGSSDSLSEDDFIGNDHNSSKSIQSDSIIFSESAEITNNVNWFVGNYSQSSSYHSDESDGHNDNEDLLLSNFKIQGVLYIQMEYCDCDLRFWLDKRAATNGKELPFEMDVIEIFTSIVKGVSHIHSRGLIHRDLKPHNIFYSQSSNTVKIGDFGLATLSGFTFESSNYTSHDRSSRVGTIPYAAPEQRQSKKYDMKVDIYSLGVILLELTNVCTTRTELCHIIEDIKDGKIERKNEKFPILENLASTLINDDPKERMSAKEILDFIDKDSKVILREVVKNEFVTEIKEQEDTNQSLREEVRDLRDRNNKLEGVVQQMQEKMQQMHENMKQMQETMQQMQETILQQSSEILRLNQVISEMNMNS